MPTLLLFAGQNLVAQNVGIGTTSPIAKLHVVGDSKFQSGNMDLSGNSINNVNGLNAATLTIGDMVNFSGVSSFSWPATVYFDGVYADGLAAGGLVDFAGVTDFLWPQSVDMDFNEVNIKFKYLNGQSGGFADFQSFGSSDVLMPSDLWEVNSSTVRIQTLELNGDFSVNGTVDFSQADGINIDEKINLDALGDVSAPSPVHGDVLTYDENQGGWVPAAGGGGGGGNVSFDQLVANQDATVDFSLLANNAITFPSEMIINSSYIQTYATIETGGSIYANGLTATESVNFANVNDCVLPATFYTPGATNFYVAGTEIGTSNNLFVGGNITTTGGLILDGGTVNFSGANIVNLGTHVSLNDMNDVNTGGVSAGNVLTFNGTSWYPDVPGVSDVRFKKDIQPLSNSLSNVLKLRGVEYNWRKEEFPNKYFQDKHQIGFIAQELEAVYPDLVNTDADGYKSVDYQKMGPILVEAIKDQQAIINAQQQELAELKARVEKAEAATASVSELMSRLEKLEAAASAANNPLTSKE